MILYIDCILLNTDIYYRLNFFILRLQVEADTLPLQNM